MNRVLQFMSAVSLLSAVLSASCASQTTITSEAASPAATDTTQATTPPVTPLPTSEEPTVAPETTAAPAVTSVAPRSTTPFSPPTPTYSTPPTTRAASGDTWGAWGPAKWPEEFRVTGAARLDFTGKEETTAGGKPAVAYLLVATGLPADKAYRLWVKTLAIPNPSDLNVEARIDASGSVIIGGKLFELRIGDPAPGEAMEFALMTADKASGVIGKIIPRPIESRQGPYRLWVELGSKSRTFFIIYGEGFQPNEEVDNISVSEGEVLKGKSKADDKGRLIILHLPAVVGKPSGTATSTVIGKLGEVSVSYQWGTVASP